jgi:hypothetical protein
MTSNKGSYLLVNYLLRDIEMVGKKELLTL